MHVVCLLLFLKGLTVVVLVLVVLTFLFLRVMRFLVPGDIVLCVPPFLLLVVVV